MQTKLRPKFYRNNIISRWMNTHLCPMWHNVGTIEMLAEFFLPFICIGAKIFNQAYNLSARYAFVANVYKPVYVLYTCFVEYVEQTHSTVFMEKHMYTFLCVCMFVHKSKATKVLLMFSSCLYKYPIIFHIYISNWFFEMLVRNYK